MFKKCRNWVVEKFWGRQKALLWLVIVLSTILITSEEAFATLNILQNPISIENTATIQKSFEINSFSNDFFQRRLWRLYQPHTRRRKSGLGVAKTVEFFGRSQRKSYLAEHLRPCSNLLYQEIHFKR